MRSQLSGKEVFVSGRVCLPPDNEQKLVMAHLSTTSAFNEILVVIIYHHFTTIISPIDQFSSSSLCPNLHLPTHKKKQGEVNECKKTMAFMASAQQQMQQRMDALITKIITLVPTFFLLLYLLCSGCCTNSFFTATATPARGWSTQQFGNSIVTTKFLACLLY